MQTQPPQVKDESLVARRRRQILDAALKLFLKKGYHATTIREICEASGVNRGSLYDYVRGKSDILVRIYRQMMGHREEGDEEAVPAEEPRDTESLEEYIRSLVSRSWNRYADEILVLYRESDALDRKTLKAVLAAESGYIERVAGELRARAGLDAGSEERVRLLANLLVFINAFLPLRGWNLRRSDPGSIVELVVEMFVKMLREDP